MARRSASRRRGDTRTVTQILFSRRREVDIFPRLHGRQGIPYPARRNRSPLGRLSAMLCKSCVVALKAYVLGITALKPQGAMVRSQSVSGGYVHCCYLRDGEAWLPFGRVTYHLGLLFLAEALIQKDRAGDLLDALAELLAHGRTTREIDDHYQDLLMHMADELYYWSKWGDGDPDTDTERLDGLVVHDANDPPEVRLGERIDPALLTDLGRLEAHRGTGTASLTEASVPDLPGARFRGPQLAELVESLDLGMHCLLVGPTATGKSLCAYEAFERTVAGKPVHIIEGHESLREYDLLGGYTPDGEGSFVWHDGVLTQAMRSGGYLFIDEANRMPTRTLNVLLGALSRGAVVLSERGSEVVQAEPGFQVVMAMNLGTGYAVNATDVALLDRFGCVLEYRYLPPEAEESLLVSETHVDPEVARIMVKVADETRRLRRGRELSGEITPRNLFAWAAKYEAKGDGNTLSRLRSAARVTWIHQVAGTDADGYLREEVAGMLLDIIEAHTPT